jgi:hypothetical protein
MFIPGPRSWSLWQIAASQNCLDHRREKKTRRSGGSLRRAQYGDVPHLFIIIGAAINLSKVIDGIFMRGGTTKITESVEFDIRSSAPKAQLKHRRPLRKRTAMRRYYSGIVSDVPEMGLDVRHLKRFE